MRTNEEKVLYGAYKLRQRITDKIRRMKENTNGLQGLSYDRPKVQASRGDSSVEKQAMKNLKLLDDIQQMQKQIDGVMQVIASLPDASDRFLLEEFTYHGSWKTSMDAFGNPRNFKKIKESALTHFSDKLRNMTREGGEQN